MYHVALTPDSYYHPAAEEETCEHTGMTRDELESICGTSEPKITKVHKVFTDGSCVVDALFDDGEDRHLFSYYIDELDFSDADLIGLTEMEAHKLRSKRDTEYLRS